MKSQATHLSSSVWGVMQPVRGRIYCAMAVASLSGASLVASLMVLAWILHSLWRQPTVWPLEGMLWLLGLTVLTYVTRIVSLNLSHFAAFRLEVILRTQLSEHVARLPLGRIQTLGAAQLAKVIFDDVKALHVFVADSTPLFARAYVAPVIVLCALFILDWRLALGALAVPCVGFLVLMLTMHGSKKLNLTARYHQAREHVAARILEFVQAMPVVRMFDSGSSSFGRYQVALAEYLSVLLAWYDKLGFQARFSMAVLSTLPTLSVLLWLGSFELARGEVSVSVFLAVLLIGAGLAEAVMPLMNLHHLVQSAQLSVSRIQNILAEKPLSQVAVSRTEPSDHSICFDNVDFRYDDASDWALKGVSFTAAAGRVTALVGGSGAGKSTVARLLPRFWDVTAGSVRVGGVDVRELTRECLMKQIAFVFQENFLFADSIANNIRLGCEEADQSAVIEAAKAAQAHEFICELPQGYDTLVGERGVFLSGGQRQRIMIARAILQNRPILVLDEATAFSDPENEAALVRALSALMRGKTVLMVAHRLSTIVDADQILVFERGRLVESGSHEALLACSGGYARLWRSGLAAQNWVLPHQVGESL